MKKNNIYVLLLLFFFGWPASELSATVWEVSLATDNPNLPEVGSLRHALDNVAEGDEITFAGTLTEIQLEKSIDLKNDVEYTIIGNQDNPVTIKAIDGYRVFNAYVGIIHFKNLKLVGNRGTKEAGQDPAYTAPYGGSLYISNAETHFDNIDFTFPAGVQVYFHGGGIYTHGVKDMTIHNCSFHDMETDPYYTSIGIAIFVSNPGPRKAETTNIRISGKTIFENLKSSSAIIMVGEDQTFPDRENQQIDLRIEGYEEEDGSKSILFRKNVSVDGIGGAIYFEEATPATPGKLFLKNIEFENNQSNPDLTSELWPSGAVRVFNVNVTVKDCLFNNNKVYGNNMIGDMCGGGALFALGGSVDIKRSQFIGNQTFGGNQEDGTWGTHGGAILAFKTSLDITDCVFSGNTTERNAGAIYANYSDVTLSGCKFHDNITERSGGALYIDNSGSDETLISLSDCEFKGNQNTGGNGMGSAIYSASSRQSLKIINTTVTDNTGSGTGGTIIIEELKSAELTNVLLAGNTGGMFGAIWNKDTPTTLTNVTIADNSTTNDGVGGAMHNQGLKTATLRNCLIWGNKGGNSVNNISGPGSTEYHYSLVEGQTTDDGENLAGPPSFAGYDLPGYDSNDPGSPPFYSLIAGTQGAEAGNNTYFLTGGTPELSKITTDLAGNSRIDGTIELGAYELLASPSLVEVIYHSNFSKGTIWADTYPQGTASATVASYGAASLPARNGYTFQYWSTATNGSGTRYTAGQTIDLTMASLYDLYAQWRENPKPPIPSEPDPEDPSPVPNPDVWVSFAPIAPFCFTDQEIRIPFILEYTDSETEYIILFSEEAKQDGLKDITEYTVFPSASYIAVPVSAHVPKGVYSGSVKIRRSDLHSAIEVFPFKVEVLQETMILVQPESITEHELGKEFVLSVEAVGDNLSYQWLLNGQLIPGATASTYKTVLRTENDGIYQVEVYGECDRALSDEVRVSSCFEVLLKWDDVMYIQNTDGRYTGFQWYRNGEAITTNGTSIYYTDASGLQGIYYVRAYYADGAYDQSCSVEYTTVTRASSVLIYPTVVGRNHYVTIVSDEFGGSYIGGVIELYNLSGGKVYAEHFLTPTIQMPVNQPAGVYILQVIAPDGRRKVEKIVVK